MITFKMFLESEEDNNIKDALKNLPKKHSNLVDGFTFTFKGGNTLPGDDAHIGYMDRKNREICVAAPWNYSREFTMLHEIAHLVWENLMSDGLKNHWKKLINNTKKDQITKNLDHSALNQNEEELFCMAYAATYSKNPPAIFFNQDWITFIKKII